MVIALGVTLKGEKVVLGFVQTATENELVCTPFLGSLVERGLDVSQGVLCVIDGSKGLRKAIDKVFAGQAAVQRGHGHKREHVVRYPPSGRPAEFRRKLQNGYQQAT
jgi:transposase-like protein